MRDFSMVEVMQCSGCAFAMLQPGDTSTRYWPHQIHGVVSLTLRWVHAWRVPQNRLEPKPSYPMGTSRTSGVQRALG